LATLAHVFQVYWVALDPTETALGRVQELRSAAYASVAAGFAVAARVLVTGRAGLARDPQPEDRAAVLGVAGGDRAAVPLRGLLHDRETEPRSGQGPRLR